MPVRILSEGHFRALESSLTDLFRSIPPESSIALVTAGEQQRKRISDVLLAGTSGILSGVELLPGIPHLAARLADNPRIREKVSISDRAAMALGAVRLLDDGDPFSGLKGNPASATALGRFFEDLLEQGITPEAYRVCSEMLEDKPGPVEKTSGRMFEFYSEERNRLYFSPSDVILASSPGSSRRYDLVIFYGFYDLNPGQRRFVKRLASLDVQIHWFSPLHPSSRWRSIYGKTGEFLRSLGFEERRRVDWNVPLSPAGVLAEAINCTSIIDPDPGTLSVSAVSGEIGAAREVLRRVSLLENGGVPLRNIAVVEKSPENSLVTRLAHHEGVPVSAPLTAHLSEFPEAVLVLAASAVEEQDFHYTSIEALFNTGRLDPMLDPGVANLRKSVLSSGVRSGLGNWRAAREDGHDVPELIEVLGRFYDTLSPRAAPVEYLKSLHALTCKLTGGCGEETLTEHMFSSEGWKYDGCVDWKTFSALLRLRFDETSIELRPGDTKGFSVLSMERVRGTLWSAVIVKDLEEGVFPSTRIDDPRLPRELRNKLELPDTDQREQEEAFLLSSTFEAASDHVSLIYMNLDSCGKSVLPSPFIKAFVPDETDSGGRSWFTRRTANPVGTLLGGRHPGQRAALAAAEGLPPGDRFFLRKGLTAERSRTSSAPFDCFDGVIGPGFYEREQWSATAFQNYVSCPFAFMAEEIWHLERDEDPGALFEPDARTRGTLVHNCIEKLISKHGFDVTEGEVRVQLGKCAIDLNLEAILGSRALLDTCLDNVAALLFKAFLFLREEQWTPLAAEKTLSAMLGDLPVRGRIDLLVRKPDGSLLVADVKTGKPKRLNNIRKEIEAGVLYQPGVYRALVLADPPMNATPETVSMAYVYIPEGQDAQIIELDAETLNELEGSFIANSIEVARLVTEGIFPPVPIKGKCDYCSFTDLCRKSPAERIDWKLGNDSRLGLLRKAGKR